MRLNIADKLVSDEEFDQIVSIGFPKLFDSVTLAERYANWICQFLEYNFPYLYIDNVNKLHFEKYSYVIQTSEDQYQIYNNLFYAYHNHRAKAIGIFKLNPFDITYDIDEFGDDDRFGYIVKLNMYLLKV